MFEVPVWQVVGADRNRRKCNALWKIFTIEREGKNWHSVRRGVNKVCPLEECLERPNTQNMGNGVWVFWGHGRCQLCVNGEGGQELMRT